jgi:hypothetical protein
MMNFSTWFAIIAFGLALFAAGILLIVKGASTPAQPAQSTVTSVGSTSHQP